MYSEEFLSEDEDDGTMPDSRDALAKAVVGRRIVAVDEKSDEIGYGKGIVITLDDGTRAEVLGLADCCAYTEIESFLLAPDKVDHIITGVGTTDGYTTWHIYADMGDVLKLSVNWYCGNQFYAYGFEIVVKPNG